MLAREGYYAQLAELTHYKSQLKCSNNLQLSQASRMISARLAFWSTSCYLPGTLGFRFKDRPLR